MTLDLLVLYQKDIKIETHFCSDVDKNQTREMSLVFVFSLRF